MRRGILTVLTAASMFVCVPAYVKACDTPPNANGSYDTGLANRNARAETINGQTANNGQATDRTMDAISRVDADNDTAADAHALPSGWQRGGNWSTTTTTTAPVRPTY